MRPDSQRLAVFTLSEVDASTLANAGHIGPCLEGLELGTAPALPLGLAADQVYDTIAGVLPPGRQIALLSGGVPEARSVAGELHGFGRLG